MDPGLVEKPKHERVIAECLLREQERLVFRGQLGGVRMDLGVWFQQADHAASKVWVDVEAVEGAGEELR